MIDSRRSKRTFVRAACAAAGCPGRVLDDRWANRGAHLVRAGIPKRVAMLTTGHKTRRVFDRYNIVSACDFREAASVSTRRQ